MSNICKNVIEFWLNLSCHIQINKNRRIFHLATLKLFDLIICGKISAKFSGKPPTIIFNQLSEPMFDKENYFSGNYELI